RREYVGNDAAQRHRGPQAARQQIHRTSWRSVPRPYDIRPPVQPAVRPTTSVNPIDSSTDAPIAELVPAWQCTAFGVVGSTPAIDSRIVPSGRCVAPSM